MLLSFISIWLHVFLVAYSDVARPFLFCFVCFLKHYPGMSLLFSDCFSLSSDLISWVLTFDSQFFVAENIHDVTECLHSLHQIFFNCLVLCPVFSPCIRGFILQQAIWNLPVRQTSKNIASTKRYHHISDCETRLQNLSHDFKLYTTYFDVEVDIEAGNAKMELNQSYIKIKIWCKDTNWNFIGSGK